MFDENEPRPIPPIPDQIGQTVTRLNGVVERLLGPNGCPWDKEQTFESTRRYVLEEACEVIDAIDSGDKSAVKEELGDLLMQVVFLSALGKKEGTFGLDDVVSGIVEKLVTRHPHVFKGSPLYAAGEGQNLDAKTADEVLANWERIKAQEKKDRGLLSGVPRSMPALVRATRIGEKVQRVGFDWEDAKGSRAKVKEEIEELDKAIESGDSNAIEDELGDVLFAIVNLSRHVKVDAEGALRRTIDKFTKRFSHVEARVKTEHGGWGDPGTAKLPLEVLDRYWEEAKSQEKNR